MTTLGRLAEEMQFGDMIIRADGDRRIIRLRDVAKTELGALAYDQVCTLDTRPSVALSIYQRPGSNTLDTARQVREKMDELEVQFSRGIDYAIVYDTTPFIRESVDEVFYALRDAVILVPSSCSCSCKAGGPRSFRSWPCRWPSSARSQPWWRRALA